MFGVLEEELEKAIRIGSGLEPDRVPVVLEKASLWLRELTPMVAVELQQLCNILKTAGVPASSQVPIILLLAARLTERGHNVLLPQSCLALAPRTRQEIVSLFDNRIAAAGDRSLARFDLTPVLDFRDLEIATGRERVPLLLVIAGRRLGLAHKLTADGAVIGRASECDVVIDDAGVSRTHAAVSVVEGDYVLRDLGSRNGIIVNGFKVEEHVLNDGDRIQLGQTAVLKFSYQDELEEAFRERLYQHATTDALTGVANRRALMERLESECAFTRRTRSPLSILMLDVDRFKSVNDTYGHLIGDAVLRDVARTLHRTLRTEDLIGRYGGEEFCVVLRGASEDQGLAAAERLRRLVADRPISHEDLRLPITVSIGVATALGGGADLAERLLRAADVALKIAKERGRNCIELGQLA